eukprot:Blabericola_migrator_1__11213@NODE_6588_length_503_cov_8_564220_g4529_i0_p1_GENE_NODE_6588_length_503_cov_8_564220_g4529_i0NODE_6588_length_503_cov_8_564220_g4529_i0_p1_ORF_typecomplete_len100_score11_44_NODE_6588_length_503_cov_8_564220_g4529_i0118417
MTLVPVLTRMVFNLCIPWRNTDSFVLEGRPGEMFVPIRKDEDVRMRLLWESMDIDCDGELNLVWEGAVKSAMDVHPRIEIACSPCSYHILFPLRRWDGV